MAYTDRDYYREDSLADSPGISGQSMVVRLIVINVVLFLADWITASGDAHWLLQRLAVHGDTVRHPLQWYQFLTAGFMHSHERLWHILVNAFGIYAFGKRIEDRLGGREMLRIYLLAIVLGNVLWGLRQYFLTEPVSQGETIKWATTYGASAGLSSLILLNWLYYPRSSINLAFVIPTPAWIVGILVIALDAAGAMSSNTKYIHAGFDNYVVGGILALAYWHFGWNFGRLPGMRRLARMGNSLGDMLTPRPRIVETEPDYEDLEEEADRLLAKVGEKGESSLTPKERKVLEQYSRWMRQKHR